MAPAATIAPSAIKTLPATLASTALPEASESVSNESFRFDSSTIAAIVLGIALFLTVVGVIGYCFWAQRQKLKRYKQQAQAEGSSRYWAADNRTRSPKLEVEKPTFAPLYAKRVSFSGRPSLSKPSAGIDITQIGHPKLIQSSQDPEPIFAEPKAVYVRTHKGAVTTVPEPQINHVVLKTEKVVPGPKTILEVAQPPPILTTDPKKRQNAPKLSLQTSTIRRNSITNAITSTTVAGLPTNIYVPPTPSRTGFGDVSFTPRTPRRMDFGLEAQAFKSNGQKSAFECFSPNDARARPNPTPRERYRFSDPTTPTPASVRSIRSLSWNGRTNDHTASFQTITLQTPISPQQLRTPVKFLDRRDWNPMDLERESMHTHPHSRAISALSTEQSKATLLSEQAHQAINAPKVKITPANDEDEILTDDDASIIESEYDSSDESSNTVATKIFTHDNRSSAGTRFSQDSITNPPLTPFYGEIKDGNPFIKQMGKHESTRLSIVNTPTRTLSSPGIEIVTRPGDESPPLSPVTFRIDNNPGTPKLPYKSEPYDRIEGDRTNDGSYPLEWKIEMERQATEESRSLNQRDLHQKSSGNSLALPLKNSKRKNVSFCLGGHHPDPSDEKPILPRIDISLAETMRRMRPSFYGIGTNDSDVSMI